MKKIIRLTLGLMFMLIVINKANAQVDTMEILRDSIYAIKSQYIGLPLYKLIYDLKVPVRFSSPDNMGSRVKGYAYYQKFLMYLPWSEDFGSCGFKIKLATYVTVSLDERSSIPHEEWDKRMRIMLGSVNVESIEKF